MFTTEERKALKARMKRGDRQMAVEVYAKMFGKNIHMTAIDHFMLGRRKMLGEGLHRGEDVYVAVSLVVEHREAAERAFRQALDSILAQQSQMARESMLF